MVTTALPWIIFTAAVLGVLALDLGVFHRKSHAVSVREATIWSIVWITLALLFNAGIYYFQGPERGLEFLTGYIIEKSLSVDNIFVFVLIFATFRVPAAVQHRVLFWGILGAFVMRGVMIAIGAALIHRFHWIIWVFGAFLIYTGIKIAVQKDVEGLHIEDNPLVKLVRRKFRMTPHYVGEKFWIRDEAGKIVLTPLVLVLIVVETSDLIFAVDSIPAIFAVTTDTFIVYTSNVFAILGLRALYFLLAGIIDRFYYLKPALSIILTFVGVKMVISHWYKIPTFISLGVILGVLALAVLASFIRARKVGAAADSVGDPRLIPDSADAPQELIEPHHEQADPADPRSE
ncbi:MAG TPA: TerC family protein [Thermoanaerobaculia bacterium]|nr:TerC family protein [Thermoanaerobaculia bacterium]